MAMPGWLTAVIGAGEVAAGGLIMASTLGSAAALAIPLIISGAAMMATGIYTQLQPNSPGISSSTRNPIAPWEVCYGQTAVGGTLIFCNEWGDNNKYLDMVFCIADHPSQYVTGLMFDRKTIQLDTTNVPAGVPPSTYPQINGGTSFTPVQQSNLDIYNVKRINGVVTVYLEHIYGSGADIPLLSDGDTVKVHDISNHGNSPASAYTSMNGIYKVFDVIHDPPNNRCRFSYLCGGLSIVFGTPIDDWTVTTPFQSGQVDTQWPDVAHNVYIEVLCGTQTLGQTFIGAFAPILDGNLNNQQPWTTTCSCVGKTVVFIRLHYDVHYFPGGIPQISFLLSGKNNIYDPRTSAYGYTENAALCIADFLCDQTYGYKMVLGTDIDIPSLITAANNCDDPIPLAIGGTEPRYACCGKFNLSQTRAAILSNMLTSCSGRISENAGKYIIQVAKWPGTGAIIPAPAFNTMGPMEWNSTGSITERYNGVKGTFIFEGNNWQSGDFPAYAQDSTHGYTLGTAWTSGNAFSYGDYTVYLGIGYQSVYPGTYTNTNHDPSGDTTHTYWVIAYQDINMTEDGERRWLDLQLPFTISPYTAQRLAKIELLRRRQFGTGVLRYNLTGYNLIALDIISLTFPPWSAYGWTNKLLEITSSQFLPSIEGLSTELQVKETDSSVYDWNSSEELTPAGYEQPILPSTQNYSVPADLTLLSNVSTAYIDPTGIARSRILVTWSLPSGGMLTTVECQYQHITSPASAWVSAPSVDAGVLELYIYNLIDGQSYNVQIRSINVNSVPSAWVEAGPVLVSGSAFLAQGPPANVSYLISTDGNGNVTASNIQVTNQDGITPAMGVTAVIYDLFYVDSTMQATTEVTGSFSPSTTTLHYQGVPPLIGYAILGYGSASAEIIYITNPAISSGVASVERGLLGTTAGTWSAITSTISSGPGGVNPLWPLEFTISAGLAIIPGMRCENSPVTNSFVSEYNSSTGLVRLTAPLGTTPTGGSTVTFLTEVTPLLSIERAIPTPSIGFFGGPNQSDFNDTFPLPSSAIVYSQMRGHNNWSGNDIDGGPTTGTDSAWYPLLFSPPLYTHGGTQITLNTGSGSLVPVGDTLDIFGACVSPDTQDFHSVSASIANISGGPPAPIPTPTPISDIRLVNQVPTAFIQITGILDSTTTIAVSVTVSTTGGRHHHGIYINPSDYIIGWQPGTYYATGQIIIDPSLHKQTVTSDGTSGDTEPMWNDSGGTTTDGAIWQDGGLASLNDIATGLAFWLNLDSIFSIYYSCSASTDTVLITDQTNQGGVLYVLPTGGTITSSWSGFNNALGIFTGSFYAIAYKDTADTYLGSVSVLVASSSTGPTGAYGGVLLGNIPISPDTRVDRINIYRGADGTPFGLSTPLYLIASIVNTSSGGTGFTTYTDTTTETTLLTLPVYGGPVQPTRAEDVVLKIWQNGNQWFQLHIPPNAYVSNAITGIALRGIAQGAVLAVESVNNIAALDINLTMG